MQTDCDKPRIAPAPLLYRWDDLVLSFSPVVDLQPHYHGAAELVVGLNQPVHCCLDDNIVTAISILIPPGVTHQNQYTDPVSATLYFDPESSGYSQLRGQMSWNSGVYQGLPDESCFQDWLKEVYETPLSPEACQTQLKAHLFAGAADNSEMDERVCRIVSELRGDPARDVTVAELAADVGLSEDRLHHLFTDQMGIPLHRFRLWLRLQQASRLYFAGHTLTYAAHDAGFADAAHFSRTFARMFGAPPGGVLAKRRNSTVRYS